MVRAAELSQPLLREQPVRRSLCTAASCSMFGWVRPLLARSSLSVADLSLIPHGADLREADRALQRELRRHNGLAQALWVAYSRQMFAAAACKFVADLLRFVPPLILASLLQLLRRDASRDDVTDYPEEARWVAIRAYALACCLPLVTMTQAIIVNQYFWRTLRLGVLVRSAISLALQRHAVNLRASEVAVPGHIANLLGTDAGRINSLFGSIHMLWSSPLQIAIALGALLRLLGWPALAGLGVMFALWPAQVVISRAIARLRLHTAGATDERLELLDSALLAARAVKLQAWETLCRDQICAARRAELRALRIEAAMKALNVLTVTLAPTLVSLATFATLTTLTGQPPHPPTVFASLALFNSLRAPLSALPDLFAALSHASVALGRLQAVLLPSNSPHSLLYRRANPCDDSTCNIALGDGFGSTWSPISSTAAPASGKLVLSAAQVPENLGDCDSSLLAKIAECKRSHRQHSSPIVLMRDASFSWQDPLETEMAKSKSNGKPGSRMVVAPHRKSTWPRASVYHQPSETMPATATARARAVAGRRRRGERVAEQPRYHGLDSLVFSEVERVSFDDERSLCRPPSSSYGPSSGCGGVDDERSSTITEDSTIERQEENAVPASVPTHALQSSSLHAISLSVKKGEVVALLGDVGCGKSSLLLAILGELHHTGGTAWTEAYSIAAQQHAELQLSKLIQNGQANPSHEPLEFRPRSQQEAVGYSGQRAWLMRGSARENILFGLPFEQGRYAETIGACALDHDFSAWPSGDETELGDRGHAVSGGQQSRLALARVVYARPSLCLIDDPFAALDASTRAHVWEAAVRKCLRHSAVVIATHSAALASKADRVLVLREGKVLQQGAPATLAAAGGAFADWLAEVSEAVPFPDEPQVGTHLRQQGESPGSSPLPSGPVVSNMGKLTKRRCDEVPDAPSVLKQGETDLQASSNSLSPTTCSLGRRHDCPEMSLARARIALDAALAAEGSRAEVVRGSAWNGYMKAFGAEGAVFGLAVCLFGFSQASIVLTDCWLARWSSLPPFEQSDLTANLGRLAALAALAAVFVAVQAGSWPLLALSASDRYHSAALSSILHAPLSALSAMPIRRVVSRFSKDLDALDVALPSMTAQALTCLAALLSSLAAVLFATPLALPVVAAVAVAFGKVVHSYQPIAAEARRLVSVLHGPVLAHILESLDGRVYIRSFGQTRNFEENAAVLIEAYSHAQIFNIALQRWLALRLELLGAWMLLAVGLLAVATRQQAALGPAGLALTYALTFTGLAKYLINYSTRAYAQLASVERLTAIAYLPDEFATCHRGGGASDILERPRPHEPSTATLCASESKAAPPADWPQRGELRMLRYQPAAYSPSGRCVLHPMTLTITPGEHVVLIGRSGAGKSTLLAGITRLLPPANGQLYIDGSEAREVGLARWRRAFACIPQEPLLLAGSIGFNLDTSATHRDSACWEALRLSGLEMRVRAMPYGLSTAVADAGLSGGERQGIVLARLLLRRAEARLVLLDEPAAATAEADSARLHGVLHERFAHTGLIAISHTALPFLHLFSRLIVLADGSIVEDGAPGALLDDPASRLSGIFSEAPHRLQAHVRRMIALQRTRGLPAVRGLWRSAHAMESEFEPELASNTSIGSPSGHMAKHKSASRHCISEDSQCLNSCSPGSAACGDGFVFEACASGSRSIEYEEFRAEHAPPPIGDEGAYGGSDLYPRDGNFCGVSLTYGEFNAFGREDASGEDGGEYEPNDTPSRYWSQWSSSRTTSIQGSSVETWRDTPRRGWRKHSFSTRSLPWSLPIRPRSVSDDAPRPLTQIGGTAKPAPAALLRGSDGRTLPWTVLESITCASSSHED